MTNVGVLIPCLLNIWGVVLFLRITWIVAQAGIVLSIVIIFISSVVCVITTLSLSVICTNGELQGADLNAIAPLITNFYLASYALINFCTFHAAFIKAISWRPRFRGISAAMYMAWLNVMSQDMPPIMFARGNSTVVIEYSHHLQHYASCETIFNTKNSSM